MNTKLFLFPWEKVEWREGFIARFSGVFGNRIDF